MLWSDKQLSFIQHSDAFLNVAHGPVRSGKTHGNLYKLCNMAIEAPPGDFAIIGKTERTAKRNVVYPLEEFAPGAVDHKEGAGELHLFGRRCYVVGANDVKAESKVRGMTLAGAYVNEWSLIPENVSAQLQDRASVDGAQIIGDTNPDSPYHYLRDMIDELGGVRVPSEAGAMPDLKSWAFKLDDNPVLPEAYKARLYRLHSGLWLARMVEGKWVIAEGVVYPMLVSDPDAEGSHVVRELPRWFERVIIGVDYATATTTVFLAAGLYRGVWYVFSEWRHDAEASMRQLSDGEQSRKFREWIEGLGSHTGGVLNPESIEIDPSAASFIKQLRDDGVTRMREADNAVVDGIRVLSTALTASVLKIHVSCEGLLREMATYSWDPKAQLLGEDKPIKKHDHGPDALRYLLMRAIGRERAVMAMF